MIATCAPLVRRGNFSLKEFALLLRDVCALAKQADAVGLEILHVMMVVTAVSLVPLAPTLRDDVDVIELNHVYDGDGRHVLSQFIFWEFQTHSASERVIAWRLWKPGHAQPLRDVRQRDCVLLFRDGENLRLVRGKHYRETWTQYDPEIDDRRFLPQHLRRELGSLAAPASVAVERSSRR